MMLERQFGNRLGGGRGVYECTLESGVVIDTGSLTGIEFYLTVSSRKSAVHSGILIKDGSNPPFTTYLGPTTSDLPYSVLEITFKEGFLQTEFPWWDITVTEGYLAY